MCASARMRVCACVHLRVAYARVNLYTMYVILRNVRRNDFLVFKC